MPISSTDAHRASSAAVSVTVADPYTAESRGCIQAYFAELQDLLEHGFDPAQTVSADPDELVPPLGWWFLAHLDGQVIGCGALKVHTADIGEIKRMWVAPSARGLGVARHLLLAIEAQAQAAGLDVLRLDTHHSLLAARRLYGRHGYQEIARYNDNPYADFWFEKRGLRAALTH